MERVEEDRVQDIEIQSDQYNDLNYLKLDPYTTEKVRFLIACWSANCFEIANGYKSRVKTLNGLIGDILEEISLNQRKNKDNWTNYKKYISDYSKKQGTAAYDSMREYLNVLLDEFDEDLFTVKTNADSIRREMRNGIYYKALVSQLETRLTNSKSLRDVANDIERVTYEMIVEFLTRGFYIGMIKDIPRRIFDDIKIEDGDIKTTYPLNRSQVYDSDGSILVEELEKFIDELDLSKRLRSFNLLFFRKRKSIDIFLILEAPDIIEEEFEISNIKIGKSVREEIIRKLSEDGEEGFEINKRLIDSQWELAIENPESYAFCKVKDIKFYDFQVAGNEARTRAESLFYLFTSAMQPMPRVKILDSFGYINQSGLQVSRISKVDPGNSISMNIESLLPDMREIANRDKNSRISRIITPRHSVFNSGNQINEAMRAFVKAEDAIDLSDKILNYWICLEKLITFNENAIQSSFVESTTKEKFSMVKRYIPYIYVHYYNQDMVINLRDYILRRSKLMSELGIYKYEADHLLELSELDILKKDASQIDECLNKFREHDDLDIKSKIEGNCSAREVEFG